MATPMDPRNRRLRPMQLNRPSGAGARDRDLPPVPERVQRSLAPDWVSPTEDNGAALPRADLHVALLARSADEARLLEHVRVIRPPFWPGQVHLHVIISPDQTVDDIRVRQAMVDLGWADSRDLLIGPPVNLTLGYPSGTDE